MLEVTLSADQSKLLSSAAEPVAVRDSAGHIVGYIQPVITPEEIAEARSSAAAPGTRLSMGQVLSNLQHVHRGLVSEDVPVTSESVRERMHLLRDKGGQ